MTQPDPRHHTRTAQTRAGQTRTGQTFSPPVTEARRWIEGRVFPADRPLLNLSQAAPVQPPPEPLRRHMADTLLSLPQAHLYGPVLGLPELREELAARSAVLYGGAIAAGNVAITAGCNQAFAATIAALTGEGDEILLPVPWYFNHKMWLDMSGVRSVPLPTGPDLLPDPDRARALITPRTRAIALVSPNNPGGVEYPGALVRAFFDLARAQGIALILDETYRDFDSRSGRPHDLFADPDWPDTLVHLYSFSKAYRLTGHRTGALIAGVHLIPEIEKFLDTVAICAPQLGQHAALWGLRNLGDWLAGERADILGRRAALAGGFAPLAAQGWQLAGLGAYFAWLRHPFGLASPDLARLLVDEAGLLMLPGTMFRPEGDPDGPRELRVAFANADRAGLETMIRRLADLGLRLAPQAAPA